VLSLTFILSTMLAIPIARAYPYEDIFKKDLLDIVNSVPQIESINVYYYSEFIATAFIRINYTAGLSDDEKISIQDNVQYQLESKWYIDTVTRNYFESFPEGPPPPWPGFEIGALLVVFKSQISTVGGFSFSVYKPTSLTPYVALATITVITAAVATAVYAKRVRRKKEKQ
jgi:hypothetical protein